VSTSAPHAKGPKPIGCIPDALWLERARTRSRYDRAWQRLCRDWPFLKDGTMLRLEHRRLLAEAAEIRDTSLRWYPYAPRTHRKLAIVYWYLTNDTGAEAHRRTALRHARSGSEATRATGMHTT